MSTSNGRSWSASSSSGDGEDHKLAYKAQWAEEAELRELREENQRLKSEFRMPAVQFEETRELARPDEDCRMEVHSEADSREKLDMRKKEITKHLRNIEEFWDLDEALNGDGLTCCQNRRRCRRCQRWLLHQREGTR